MKLFGYCQIIIFLKMFEDFEVWLDQIAIIKRHRKIKEKVRYFNLK